MQNVVIRYLELIDSGEYYEAHEVMEILWRGYDNKNSSIALVAKAFINAAVALEHHKRGNHSGAIKCAQTYIKYRPLLDELGFKSDSLQNACVVLEKKLSQANLNID
jgi:hypothetical protein